MSRLFVSDWLIWWWISTENIASGAIGAALAIKHVKMRFKDQTVQRKTSYSAKKIPQKSVHFIPIIIYQFNEWYHGYKKLIESKIENLDLIFFDFPQYHEARMLPFSHNLFEHAHHLDVLHSFHFGGHWQKLSIIFLK